jgi:hypothetical protein
MMYHIEFFNNAGKAGEMEDYFQKVALPYFKKKGFEVYFFATQYGLGNKEFCFVKSIEGFGSVDLWDNKARGEAEGKAIMENLEKLMTDIRADLVTDLEPEVKWIREPGKMYHLENFNSTAEKGKLEKFFIEEAFPYLRNVGFNIKLFKTLHKLGQADFWFITEMDSFASLDKWPQMAAGKPQGEEIMKKLLDIIDIPRATILKEMSGIGSSILETNI